MTTAVVSVTPEPRAEAAPLTELEQFFGDVLPGHGPHYCVFDLQRKRHLWADSHAGQIALTAGLRDTHSVYYLTATTDAESRTQQHVVAKMALYVDLDAGPDKFARDPAGTYETNRDALAALVAFCKSTGLMPTYIIHSGTGLHVYWALDKEITTAEWLPLAKALGAKAKALGLKVDPSCTTDSARVLRIPGGLHKNGNRVRVLKRPGKKYTVDELRTLLHVEDAAPAPARARPALIDVNAKLQMWEPAPSSAIKAANECPALRSIAECGGDVPEPPWRRMLGVIKFSIEGSDLAHEWSSGHPSYDRVETQAKLDGWNGTGPTTCDEFAKHSEACATCEHRGTITTPLQLGRLTAPEVQVMPDGERPAAPKEFAELNSRYALVRMGSEVVVCDFQTPTQAVEGIVHGVGFLSSAALRQTYADRTIKVGTETRPLVDQWLKSPHRRQYEGCVFSPGAEVPPNILNLYQGFAVAAAAGSVAPWLRLLEGSISDPKTRRFVLRLLAWKVQNPGGVPGTILILTGSKGTGKNSLVDPIVRMFGAHAAVFDDSEQVAGRFTGHLMTLAFAVMDEALFTGDPRQMDRIKARVTATAATYEFKGRDPIRGVNRCAFVSLTNHPHVWQATIDERRAVVVEVADMFRGDREFWTTYYAWLDNGGSGALLHHLLALDLSGFDPRQIPKTEALNRQIEMTALRSAPAAWWHVVLSEGAVSWRDEGHNGRRTPLNEDEPTSLEKEALRLSFVGGDSRRKSEWANAMRQLRVWVGPAGLREVRAREGTARTRLVELPSLNDLRASFSAATGVRTYD